MVLHAVSVLTPGKSHDTSSIVSCPCTSRKDGAPTFRNGKEKATVKAGPSADCVGLQVGNTPANENREERSNMANEKVIMLIEAKILPQRRAELVEAARQYLPLVRAEQGVEAFYLTARKDDPDTFVFYVDLQVASSPGLPSPAGLHQEIPGDTKERAGRRPSADKPRRVGPRRIGPLELGRSVYLVRSASLWRVAHICI
jgi:hypothetical protein